MYGWIITTKDGTVINNKEYGYVLSYTDEPQVSIGVISVLPPEMPVEGIGGEVAANEAIEGVSNREFKPSPKHDPKSGWGSPDPIPNIEIGQEVLDTAYSSSKTKQLYNIYDGKLVKFQPDTVSGWHSYLVENAAKEVPADVLRQMLKDGKITKAEYKNFIKNN